MSQIEKTTYYQGYSIKLYISANSYHKCITRLTNRDSAYSMSSGARCGKKSPETSLTGELHGLHTPY
ncbi:MAG: hypothetical protein Q8N35_18580, partial [Methylococcaceae bacterium]|nr:hypothetical protein [Methylococcaceae bacterium]MDP3021592.1 hypothetical protein [Methylococcaceae bacterium]MDP3389243.1 hypothetical protein [Methylococcaceae bacterium]